MDYWFLISGAILSIIGTLFHGIAGQSRFMANVYTSDMPSLTKSLSLVNWHVFTIYLLISGLTLIYVAYYPSFYIATYPIIAVNVLGATLFIFLGLGNHKALLTMPGAYLMGGTALLSWLGIS